MVQRVLYGGIITAVVLFCMRALPVFAQATTASTIFGQNKVQYKNITWYYIQTEHFNVYFYEDGAELAEYVAEIGEQSLKKIENVAGVPLKERVPISYINHIMIFSRRIPLWNIWRRESEALPSL